MHLNPAQFVIRQFGGVIKTARLLGLNKSSVSRWKKGTPSRPYGRIPTTAQTEILNLARLMAVDITPEDLIKGREIRD